MRGFQFGNFNWIDLLDLPYFIDKRKESAQGIRKEPEISYTVTKDRFHIASRFS
jgi:hypothetical protein